MRELVRGAAALFDEIEFDGVSLLVIRHGRAVARITPTANAFPVKRFTATEPEDFDFADIKEIHRAIMLKAAAIAPASWGPHMMSGRELEANVAAGLLEFRGWLVREWGGFRLTATGARAAACLLPLDGADSIDGS